MEAALKIDFPEWFFNPDTGRFLSEDPIGFDGGDSNLYRYVGNNLINFTDPFGEVPWGQIVKLLLREAVKYCFINTSICATPPTPLPEKDNPKPETPLPSCDPTKQSCKPIIDDFLPPSPSLPKMCSVE